MSDFSAPSPDTPLGPRSQLVSSFCDWLNRDGAVYAIMNNYDELPWVIPSDVDFTVSPELFSRLDKIVADFAEAQGAVIIQKLWHGNRKCAYIVGIGPASDGAFVQLDCFVAFSTKHCPGLIEHEDLVDGRRPLRNFFVPRPKVELLFTVMRRLFKDDWEARHCDRVAELHAQISGAGWLPARYVWLEPTIKAAVAGDLETVNARRAEDWDQLKQVASGTMSVPEQASNLALQTRRIMARLRDETGHLALLTAPTDFDPDALDALELVFHRWMVLDDAALSKMGAVKLAILPLQLWLLKRRKGLIFLQAGPDAPKGAALALWLQRLGLIDEVLTIGGPAEVAGITAPRVPVSSASEAIEAIVERQTAKTARAMKRGGTQTSG